jgi:formyl-CoA transferase
LLPYEEGSEATEALKALFAGKTQKEWVELLENMDVCFTPILTPEETLENRHLKERETFTTMDDPERGETVQIGFPARFSEPVNFKRSPAPFFGQHTRAILADLGYTASQMEILKKDRVI